LQVRTLEGFKSIPHETAMSQLIRGSKMINFRLSPEECPAVFLFFDAWERSELENGYIVSYVFSV
jgi:hypothetical protein